MVRHDLENADRKIISVNLSIGYIAVLLGTLCGVLQVLVRSSNINLPSFLNYYQILTAHGLLLAIVFTTYFIFAFLTSGMCYSLGSFGPKTRFWNWVGFWVMSLGTTLAIVLIVMNEASVLYTFYAPMKANPWFYIGLALFVVGTWISSFALIAHYNVWKKANKGETSPLFAFMTIVTLLLWIIACLGVVVTVLFQFIPWAFGWVDTINVELSRTLFWYFGHPLVYFWLLPAYIAWYTIVPKLIGGKIFSDSLARMSFILFLFFSIPVGFHHQLVDPGISQFWKFLQTVLTFMVIFPSLMTAFAMFATFERKGRQLGGKGLFGWFKKLPWGDVRFTAMFVAMLFFIPGGAGGIINASFQMNEVIHNTLWVVGHFHITVGTPVVMTFFAITFWLVPYLRNRVLTPAINRLAMVQVILWSIGMILMSTSQHILGLIGAPRRTSYTTYGDHPQALKWFDGLITNQLTMAIGGTILFVAAMLMIYIVVHLYFFAPKTKDSFFPLVEEDNKHTPKIFEKWWLWILITFILILLAYAIPVNDIIQHTPGVTGMRTW